VVAPSRDATKHTVTFSAAAEAGAFAVLSNPVHRLRRTKSKKEQAALNAYAAIAATFYRGLLRLGDSRIAALQSSIAIVKANTRKLPARDDHPLWEIVDSLCAVEFAEFDSFEYITDVSYLVRAATLFDTFFSETTRFLFLRNPRSLGSDCQIPLDTLLEARSKSDALNRLVEKKARDLAYLSLPERLKDLGRRFGLKPDFSPGIVDDLDDFSSTRNTMVHDQGFYDIKLDSRGRLAAEQRACARHRTPITRDELRRAVDAYTSAVRTIAAAVFTQVLHVVDDTPESVVVQQVLSLPPEDFDQRSLPQTT
jgi:hypothetical protein